MSAVTPLRFRKKPVVISAIQFKDLDDYLVICGWVKMNGDDPAMFLQYSTNYMRIFTLEGWHTANPGDWIIRGVKGEYYPCKPDIFEMTYELESSPAGKTP